jgi:hypothetical protein
MSRPSTDDEVELITPPARELLASIAASDI